jgi:hypothetical protein
MVFVFAFGFDVEIAFGIVGERFEKVIKHFGGHIANFFPFKIHVPYQPRTPAEVDGRLREAIVHWQQEAVAFDAFFLSQCLRKSLTQRNGRILDGVVFVYMKIAFYFDIQVDISVTGNLFQHVIKKSQAGGNTAFSRSVKVHFDTNIGFECFPCCCSLARFGFQKTINFAPVARRENGFGMRLIVMQTFSKAWALAGARVGIAYAQPEIIALLNKTKPPYNVSKLNQEAALKALSKKKATQYRIATILEQKKILAEKLPTLSFVKKVYPSDANFLLVEMENADAVYTHLIEKKVITRNRSSQVKNCIRITVGSPKENRMLMNELKKMEQ